MHYTDAPELEKHVAKLRRRLAKAEDTIAEEEAAHYHVTALHARTTRRADNLRSVIAAVEARLRELAAGA